jgi:hypothetical protein
MGLATAARLSRALDRRWWARQASSRQARLGRGASFDLALSLLFALAALVLALTHSWNHGFIGEAQYGDAAYWDYQAEIWARGYAATKSPDIRPGYSFVMGSVYALIGPDYAHAYGTQAILFALGTALLYLTGRRLGGRLAGVLVASQFALNPYMWEWTSITTSDLVGSIANVAALYFLVDALRGRGRFGSAAWFGVFLAIANTVRVFSFFYVAPALVILLLLRTSWRRRLALGATVLGAVALTMLPAVVYQYVTTGEGGLSSNSASAAYGASSPKYGQWTNEMYEEVAAPLRAQGIAVTQKTLDAEFWRLTLQNYRDYPEFQVRRVLIGVASYADFESEVQLPDRFRFSRPYVLVAGIVLAAGLALAARPRRCSWAPLGALALALGLVAAPLRTVWLVQWLAPAWSLGAVVRRRGARELGFLAVALYWGFLGFMAVLTAGISGGLLFRLYTQVEPARALLLGVMVSYLIALLLPPGLGRARLLDLDLLVRRMPSLPRVARTAVQAALVVLCVAFSLGTARLAMANVLAPRDAPDLPVPSEAELAGLAARLGLPGPLTYAAGSTYGEARARVTSSELPTELKAYVFPGQFTRFVWYVQPQDRSMFWFVWSDRVRPRTLDLDMLWGEAQGRMRLAEFRDRFGLLVFAPTNVYAPNSDTPRMHMIATRAFVPWDEAAGRFRLEAPIIFPLSIPLLDAKRMEMARKEGQVTEIGSLQIRPEEGSLATLGLRPTEAAGAAERSAAITFPDVLMPPGARFQTAVSLHPRLIGNPNVGPLRLELRVRAAAQNAIVAVREIEPRNREEWRYVTWEADLSGYAGQRVDLTLRAVTSSASAEPGEVVTADPRVVMP